MPNNQFILLNHKLKSKSKDFYLVRHVLECELKRIVLVASTQASSQKKKNHIIKWKWNRKFTISLLAKNKSIDKKMEQRLAGNSQHIGASTQFTYVPNVDQRFWADANMRANMFVMLLYAKFETRVSSMCRCHHHFLLRFTIIINNSTEYNTYEWVIWWRWHVPNEAKYLKLLLLFTVHHSLFVVRTMDWLNVQAFWFWVDNLFTFLVCWIICTYFNQIRCVWFAAIVVAVACFCCGCNP